MNSIVQVLFGNILEMSIMASYVIAVVFVVRLILGKKLPKLFSYAIWGVVLLRLVIPVYVPSSVSMFNLVRNTSPIVIEEKLDDSVQSVNLNTSAKPEDSTEINNTNNHTRQNAVEGNINEAVESNPVQEVERVGSGVKEESIKPINWNLIGAYIWVSISILLVILCIIMYLLITLKLRKSKEYLVNGNKVYKSDKVDSPVVIGLFKTKIILSSNIEEIVSEDELNYIIEHEKTHIRRFDPLLRIISILVLCIHWFNPLVWLAFFFSNKDRETSCDETVLRKSNGDIRGDYANALVNIGGKKRYGYKYLAFGENNIKDRIKNVISFKNPKAIAIVSAIVMVLLIGIVSLTGAIVDGKDDSKVDVITEIFSKVNDDIYVLEEKDFRINDYDIEFAYCWNEEESIVYEKNDTILVKQNLVSNKIEWEYQVKKNFTIEDFFSKGNCLFAVQSGEEDIIACLDSSGTEIWSKNIEDTEEDRISLYGQEYVFIENGFLISSWSEVNKRDVSVLKKYDYDGNLIWEKRNNLKYDNFDGNLYVTDENIFLISSYFDAPSIFTKFDVEGNLLKEEKILSAVENLSIGSVTNDRIYATSEEYDDIHIFTYDLDFNLISDVVIKRNLKNDGIFATFEDCFYLHGDYYSTEYKDKEMVLCKYDYDGNFLEETTTKLKEEDLYWEIYNSIGKKIFYPNLCKTLAYQSGQIESVEKSVIKLGYLEKFDLYELYTDEFTEIVDINTKNSISLADLEKGDLVYLVGDIIESGEKNEIVKYKPHRMFVLKREDAEAKAKKEIIGKKELGGSTIYQNIDKDGNGYIIYDVYTYHYYDDEDDDFYAYFPCYIKLNVTEKTKIWYGGKDYLSPMGAIIWLDSPITDLTKTTSVVESFRKIDN